MRSALAPLFLRLELRLYAKIKRIKIRLSFVIRFTLIGSVNKLFDMFPDKEFYAFAVMRTISNISEFKNWYAPVTGTITLQEDGNTLRRP